MYGEEHACVHGSWIVPEAGISLRPISLLITFRRSNVSIGRLCKEDI